jgi:hypothetical protein
MCERQEANRSKRAWVWSWRLAERANADCKVTEFRINYWIAVYEWIHLGFKTYQQYIYAQKYDYLKEFSNQFLQTDKRYVCRIVYRRQSWFGVSIFFWNIFWRRQSVHK